MLNLHGYFSFLHGYFYHYIPQVSVQPVTTTGPEHSKPLEKSESLFAQDRDPRFSEIYSNISTGMFFPYLNFDHLLMGLQLPSQ